MAMRGLEKRRIPFEFNGVEFPWNRGQPPLLAQTNIISYPDIGSEKHFCGAMADAAPLVHAVAARERDLRGRQDRPAKAPPAVLPGSAEGRAAVGEDHLGAELESERLWCKPERARAAEVLRRMARQIRARRRR